MLGSCLGRHSDAKAQPFYHGILAFAYEQNKMFREAEAEARLALEIERTDIGAQHAIAHVMEMEGRVGDGSQYLTAYSATWSNCNAEMYSHLWWHLGLMHLDQGDQGKALEYYDEFIWGEYGKSCENDRSRFPINAIHMLWRLQLAGCDVGDRWSVVAEKIAGRAEIAAEPYPSLLYLYAYLVAERSTEVTKILHNFHELAEHDSVWREVVLPLAHALIAFVHQDRAGMLLYLNASQGISHDRMGYSVVQRGVLEMTTIDMAIAIGDAETAHRQLDTLRTQARIPIWIRERELKLKSQRAETFI